MRTSLTTEEYEPRDEHWLPSVAGRRIPTYSDYFKKRGNQRILSINNIYVFDTQLTIINKKIQRKFYFYFYQLVNFTTFFRVGQTRENIAFTEIDREIVKLAAYRNLLVFLSTRETMQKGCHSENRQFIFTHSEM